MEISIYISHRDGSDLRHGRPPIGDVFFPASRRAATSAVIGRDVVISLLIATESAKMHQIGSFPSFGADMPLADFILRDMEDILAQWEAFAGTLLPAAANMRSLALRDHAQQILEAVAKDLSTSQSSEAQFEKSIGLAPKKACRLYGLRWE
jgi:hypothetical protein